MLICQRNPIHILMPRQKRNLSNTMNIQDSEAAQEENEIPPENKLRHGSM